MKTLGCSLEAILAALNEALCKIACCPTQDHVDVILFLVQLGELKSPFRCLVNAMWLKSRDNADLFRIPERWRRPLRMRLACSLASVSQHTVHYEVASWTSNGLLIRRWFMGEIYSLAYLTAVGLFTGQRFSDSWRSECHQIQECNRR